MDNLAILKNKNFLYVEDDQVIRDSITHVLKMFCDNITTASDGGEAISLIDNFYDVIILDLNLPIYNGFEIAKAFRQKHKDSLIFMLSSYQDIQNLRTAMKVGAIDFLAKPIGFEELKTVLEDCANRVSQNSQIIFGDYLIYDMKLKTVFKDNNEIKLTKNEITFLELVLNNKNQLISYDRITEELSTSKNTDINLPSIKNMILRLRKKLGVNLVESVFGVGYRVL